MIQIAIALALAFAAFQEKEAAEFLKKVEDKAASAKSLRWKATAKVGADHRELNLAVEACFAEGNRARLSAASKDEATPLKFTFTCDGKRVRTVSSKQDDACVDADKGFAAALNRILVRGGLIAINHLKPDATGDDLLASVKISDLSLSDEKIGDRETKVIRYTIDGGADSAAAKLWVDAKTLALIKRDVKGKSEPVIHEEFDEWTVDAELKDEIFKVAEK